MTRPGGGNVARYAEGARTLSGTSSILVLAGSGLGITRLDAG